MVTEIWVNIGSGNGLLPDGTKPLPEPMLTDHQSNDHHIMAISQEMPQSSIIKICLKITRLKFHSNFPGANEFTHCDLVIPYSSMDLGQHYFPSLAYHPFIVKWFNPNQWWCLVNWGLWSQKPVSQAGISNCIPQLSVGCNYLSLHEIPASGTKVLI